MSTRNDKKTKTITGLDLAAFRHRTIGLGGRAHGQLHDRDGRQARRGRPLGYRTFKPVPTLIVDEQTGAIKDGALMPKTLSSSTTRKSGPLRHFFEVFASRRWRVRAFDARLAQHNGLVRKPPTGPIISWRVWVANRRSRGAPRPEGHRRDQGRHCRPRSRRSHVARVLRQLPFAQ